MTCGYEITEYLLKHHDGIKEYLKSKASTFKYAPVFQYHYEEQLLSELAHILAEATGRSFEEVSSVVTKEYIVSLLGKDFFKL